MEPALWDIYRTPIFDILQYFLVNKKYIAYYKLGYNKSLNVGIINQEDSLLLSIQKDKLFRKQIFSFLYF